VLTPHHIDLHFLLHSLILYVFDFREQVVGPCLHQWTISYIMYLVNMNICLISVQWNSGTIL